MATRPTRLWDPARALVLVFFAVIGACIQWLDRPFSMWAASHLHTHRPWFDGLTHIVDPLVPLAALAVLAVIAGRLIGRELGALGRPLIIAALAFAVAVMMKDQAKFLFGRLWPETWVDNNPSWIGSGSYGFFPMHGGRGWSSFPSGHMTVITAPATTLSRAFPWARPYLVLACVAVAFGLLGADYHFLSDVIAGTGLGTLCGWVVLCQTTVPSASSIPHETGPMGVDWRDHSS